MERTKEIFNETRTHCRRGTDLSVTWAAHVKLRRGGGWEGEVVCQAVQASGRCCMCMSDVPSWEQQ